MSSGVRVTEINMAVYDLDEAMNDYDKMGFEEFRRFEAPEVPVQAKVANARLGDNDVVLTVMASTESGSPIDRFLQKRGEGIFSITIFCDNLDETIERFKSAGVGFVLEEPRVIENNSLLGKTYRRSKVTWSRPKGAAHGLLFELWEHQE